MDVERNNKLWKWNIKFSFDIGTIIFSSFHSFRLYHPFLLPRSFLTFKQFEIEEELLWRLFFMIFVVPKMTYRISLYFLSHRTKVQRELIETYVFLNSSEGLSFQNQSCVAKYSTDKPNMQMPKLQARVSQNSTSRYRVFQFTSHFHVTVPQLDKKSESQNWSKRTLHNGAQWLVQNQVVVQSCDVVTSKQNTL